MPYTEPSAVEIFKRAADDARVEIEASFNQLDDVLKDRGRKGICSGLAGLWLHQLERGDGNSWFSSSGMSKQFVDQVTIDTRGRDKAAKWNKNQDQTPWLAPAALQTPKPKYKKESEVITVDNEDKKSTTFKLYIRRHGADGDGSRYTITSDTLDGMVDWINATTGKRRFFLIEIPGSSTFPGHTMAAAKNRKGLIRFYDPNGGVAGTWMSRKMLDFLRFYLATPKIFNAYCDRLAWSPTLCLELDKYCPAEW
jgi:hypothetical protein